MSEFSNVTVENHIAVLEIDHAPANALSSHVIQELRDQVKQLNEQEDVHAIIITGKGRFFVAGADIKEFIPAMGNDENGLNMAKAGQALCDEIEALRKPVIAAVNGPALGNAGRQTGWTDSCRPGPRRTRPGQSTARPPLPAGPRCAAPVRWV